MSVVGLEESEKIAKRLNAKLKSSFKQQYKELEQELKKVEYLLGDRQASLAWANSPAGSARIQQILSSLNEVEQLYLNAGNSNAAKIFKDRVRKQLTTKLTNLRANEIELKIKMEKLKVTTQKEVLSGLTEVKREGALREMYDQSRAAGGFFASFGRGYLNDLITLETKAAGSKTLGEYMKNMYNTYEKNIRDVFIAGIVRGDSYKQMTNALASATGLTTRKADLIITTEANAIFNESVRDVINDNPLVKGYRFRAVLDSRTSKICQEHDGDYIPKDKVQPGVNYPPLHPRCRSTVTTVLASEDERKDTMQRYTKNNRNQWEKVPPGMSYREYKDKFGFANSNNPRTYNAATRDIRDTTPAKIDSISYRGYVKPSASSTSRIQEMITAYVDHDDEYIAKVKQNTHFDETPKALFRQAQAESGFDGLPLKLSGSAFEKEVQKKGYKVVYRQFGSNDDFKSFLEGDQMYGSGQSIYGQGTYAFSSMPSENTFGDNTVVMALRSDSSKILDLKGQYDSQGLIADAMTPDERINDILRRVPREERRNVLSLAATEYGYDAIEATSQKNGDYTLVLNRTAVIVKDPEPEVALPEELPPVEVPEEMDWGRFRREYFQDSLKAKTFELESHLTPKRRHEEFVKQVTGTTPLQVVAEDSAEFKEIKGYTLIGYATTNKTSAAVYRGIVGYTEKQLERTDTLVSALYRGQLAQDTNLTRKVRAKALDSYLGLTDSVRFRYMLEEKSPDLIGAVNEHIKGLKEPLVLDRPTSTTFIAGSFGGDMPVELQILAPKGTPGLSIEAVTSLQNEYEFIIPPGVRYMPVSAYMSTNVYGEPMISISVRILEGDYRVPKEFSRTLAVLEEVKK